MASRAAVGSSSRAAVGFRVHSGWAAFVAVSLDRNQPKILARGRPHLVESFTYRFRQPYHTAESMNIVDARAFISSVETEATRLAGKAVETILTTLQTQGHELTILALIRGSGKPLPILAKILASHALIHTADGDLFRDALAQACRKCSLENFEIKEKELTDRACNVLGLSPTLLTQKLVRLGRSIGAPWSQDEKLSTLAAWVALQAGNTAGR